MGNLAYKDYTIQFVNKTNYSLTITAWWYYPMSKWHTLASEAMLFINEVKVSGNQTYNRVLSKFWVPECYISCKLKIYAPSKPGSWDILFFYTSQETLHKSASYHDVYYVRKADRTSELTIENTADQLQEIRVQEIFKEGQVKLQEGKLEEALSLFKEALNLTKDDSVKRDIEKSIAIAEERTDNVKAQQLHKEGVENLRQGKFEEAINKLDEALRYIHDQSLKEAIQRHLTQAYGEWGAQLEKQGYDLERDLNGDHAEEAKARFEEAVEKYRKAAEYEAHFEHESEYEKKASLLATKNFANEMFNYANLLEKQAFEQFQKAQLSGLTQDYEKAKSMYDKVMQKYKEAAILLDKAGDEYGRDWAERSKHEVEQIMEDLLRHTIDSEFIGRLTFKENIEDDELEYDVRYDVEKDVPNPIDSVVNSGRKSNY